MATKLATVGIWPSPLRGKMYYSHRPTSQRIRLQDPGSRMILDGSGYIRTAGNLDDEPWTRIDGVHLVPTVAPSANCQFEMLSTHLYTMKII